jgi:hypothetical protein
MIETLINIGTAKTLCYDYRIKGFCKGEVDTLDGEKGRSGKAITSFIIWRDDLITDPFSS